MITIITNLHMNGDWSLDIKGYQRMEPRRGVKWSAEVKIPPSELRRLGEVSNNYEELAKNIIKYKDKECVKEFIDMAIGADYGDE